MITKECRCGHSPHFAVLSYADWTLHKYSAMVTLQVLVAFGKKSLPGMESPINELPEV